MSLRSIVRQLGGELYDNGHRANIPAPGHSRRDRSVSLLWRDGRLIVHTFGDSDWRQVRDYLRGLGLMSGLFAGPGSVAAPNPRPRETARRAVAAELWAQGRAIAQTPSARHCRLRRIVGPLPGPHLLRHHGLAPLSVYAPTERTRPALLTAITDPQDQLAAIEITYLSDGGRVATGLRLPRKTIGVVPAGSAARIDPAAPEMLVAEGLFTTLSARGRFALPSWALMSTSNLRFWRPPPGVRSVLIAADRGPDGEASAQRLAGALEDHGLRTRMELPPAPFGDWNEAAEVEA